MIRQSISSEVEALREIVVLSKGMEIVFAIPESGNAAGTGGVMETMS